MADYKIYFKESVEKELSATPKKDQNKIMKRIGQLAKDPRPTGCEKLTGRERYRLRQGRYRILYSIQAEMLVVYVVKIGHRKYVYR